MTILKEDWRLFRQQEKYLTGVELIKHPYVPRSTSNDHDHCEFCMAKFGFADGDLHLGYSTKDNGIWICEQCFYDFKEKFNWKVLSAEV